jgi:protein-S-isoprenylcysteine O-methyltransferase Ste14
MSIWNKIVNTLYKVTTSSRKVRAIYTPIGLVFFSAFVLSYVIASLELDKLLKFPMLLPSSANIIVSIPILIIGLFMIFMISWSMITFLRKKGTPVPFNPPPKLVLNGPYTYMRNPMLTGLFITLFGCGIYFNSISLTFIFTPFFIICNLIEIKYIEEPELEKRLGKEYLEYKKKVPRFIPKFKTKNYPWTCLAPCLEMLK